ncbi:MAG: prepilin-type N-terminal cleavage/methylation domain-containing protein [Candidatus Daviesbacteria bacterium]|nr:prepilin-type N-terminal cleavage/methylation domain-containing protein [Candidatus Daviesbacteria bacterium]
MKNNKHNMRGFTRTNFNNFKQNLNGFTLVELLVVIAIIAILVSISIGVFAGLQKSGRDAKRKSDLATIQSALEQYHADQNVYPANVVTAGTSLTNRMGINPTPVTTKTYLATMPKEVNPTPYVYEKNPTSCDNTMSDSSKYCTKYCLYATLENPGPTPVAPCNTAGSGNYSVSAP